MAAFYSPKGYLLEARKRLLKCDLTIMLFNTIKRHTTIKNISSENILSFSYGSTNDFPEKFYTFADVCKTNEKSTRQTDILKRRYQRIIFNL